MSKKAGKSKGKQKQPPRPPIAPLDIPLSAIPPFAAFCLKTFVVPCTHEDGSVAACVTTHHVLMGLAVGMTVLVIMRLLAADKATKRSFDLLLVISGAAFALLPGGVLPLCADASMTCHTVMHLFARIVGAVVAVLALLCELTGDHEEPTGRRRRR